MSYHIAILRTNGKQAIPITQEEVEGLAGALPGWEYDANQKTLIAPGRGDETLVLRLDRGELWTQNPTRHAIEQMLLAATHLGARVRGDEFETYRTADETYLHLDDTTTKAEAEIKTRALIRNTRLKSWIFHAILFGGFILLILLFEKLGFLK